MWAVSIVLCSVCKNSKSIGFDGQKFKNERLKNTRKSDQIRVIEKLKVKKHVLFFQWIQNGC